jgi:type IV pilus assembly protein PilQ
MKQLQRRGADSRVMPLRVLSARVMSSTRGVRGRIDGGRVVVLALFAVLATIVAPGIAAAQDNGIQDVTTSQQGGNLVVRIGLKSAPVAAPASFSIATPPRIALDFTRTSNDTGKNVIDANQGDLRSLNLVTSGDRTRVVLNLKRSVAFTSAIDGNAIVVTLTPGIADGGGSNIGSTRAPTTRFAESTTTATAAPHSIRDIDFRRGADGSGRVIIDLSDSQTGTDIRTQGQTIVVDFLKSALPDSLRRRLDVTDFSTPVQSINTFTQGDNVRMVIEPRGLWEHNAYQTDNRLVVEVKPLKEDPNKLFQSTRAGYKGERLSLNFQNVDVRSLLQVIADFTNLNIITSDSVNGNLTLRLKDVPWDQALDIVLQSKGLDMRKNGNVILVAPKDELAAKEKLDLESRSQIADLEPLRSETFQLNYQKAQDLVDFLNGTGTSGGTTGGGSGANRVLSKRGAASADIRTNQVFILETGTKLEQIRAVIAKLDVPSRQVIIESRIVEANDNFSKNLGFKLGYNTAQNVVPGQTGQGRYRVTGNYLGVGEQTGQTTAQGTGYIPDTQFFSLPAAAINGLNPAAIGVSLFNSAATKFLNLELSALESDGQGKIVSSPRVVTADSVKALIEQGTELPYQVATSSGATSIQFRKANLKLEVTPQITPEGNIILDVDVTKDSVGQVTTAGFAIDTKHVNTKVLVENGGTVVLGGIFQLTDTNTITKVPLLGDVPVLGYLFRNTSRSTAKSELLIFITPTMVNGQVVLR